VARGVLIERTSTDPLGRRLPPLLRVTSADDPEFANELESLWLIRARRGRGPQLRAARWHCPPVAVELADGRRLQAELLPPFLAWEHPPEETEYLMQEVFADN
jgi:hypothetical protein